MERKGNLITCEVCGKEVYSPPSGIGRKRYCSKECKFKGRQTGKQITCAVCGKQVYARPCENKRQFCSRECKYAASRLVGPGARQTRSDGYVVVYYRAHPDADAWGRVLEHRLVAEKKYGRRILPSEHVHHINGIRDDNRPENLIILASEQHNLMHLGRTEENWQRLEAEVREYRRLYGPLPD